MSWLCLFYEDRRAQRGQNGNKTFLTDTLTHLITNYYYSLIFNDELSNLYKILIIGDRVTIMLNKFLFRGIALFFCICSLSLQAGDFEELQKLVASDRATEDLFGLSVAISGDYAIIGAYGEDASGLSNTGSAYIFYWNGTAWNQQAKIVASDREAWDGFGYSVSISEDYAIVGAYYEDEDATGNDSLSNAGSAYIFKRESTSWYQQAKIVASDRAANDLFGYSVSISDDYAIVGSPNENEAGSAYIFMRYGANWTQQKKIIPSDRIAHDWFGESVSISGDYAIIGAPYEDHDADCNNTLNYAGSSYIFMRDGTNWDQQAKIVASDRAVGDWFGWSVSISGDYAIVGAPYKNRTGAAFIFKRNGENWDQQAKLLASDRAPDDDFGWSVSISGDNTIIGAYSDYEDASDNNTLKVAGSAYIFMREGTSWNQQAKIVASDRAAFDRFASSVSISDSYAIVGSPYKNEITSGDNTLKNAGSAYIYSISANETSIFDNYNTPSFILGNNRPNPLNPTTTISYELPEAQNITLRVFDITGRLVETLYSGYKEAGKWDVKWNASNQSSGVYIYRLQVGDRSISKKMVVLK
jgi:hypothetical protein